MIRSPTALRRSATPRDGGDSRRASAASRSPSAGCSRSSRSRCSGGGRLEGAAVGAAVHRHVRGRRARQLPARPRPGQPDAARVRPDAVPAAAARRCRRSSPPARCSGRLPERRAPPRAPRAHAVAVAEQLVRGRPGGRLRARSTRRAGLGGRRRLRAGPGRAVRRRLRGVDAARAARLGHRGPPSWCPVLGVIYLVDLMLSPIGFMAVLASEEHPYAYLLAVPPGGLLALIAHERRRRLDNELGSAARTGARRRSSAARGCAWGRRWLRRSTARGSSGCC